MSRCKWEKQQNYYLTREKNSTSKSCKEVQRSSTVLRKYKTFWGTEQNCKPQKLKRSFILEWEWKNKKWMKMKIKKDLIYFGSFIENFWAFCRVLKQNTKEECLGPCKTKKKQTLLGSLWQMEVQKPWTQHIELHWELAQPTFTPAHRGLVEKGNLITVTFVSIYGSFTTQILYFFFSLSLFRCKVRIFTLWGALWAAV